MKTKKFFRGLGLSLLFWIIWFGLQIIGAIVVSIVADRNGYDPLSGNVLLISLCAGWVLMILFVPLFYRWIKKSAFKPMELNKIKPMTAVLSIALGVLLNFFTQSGFVALLPTSLQQQLMDQQQSEFAFTGSSSLVWLALGIAILGPIAEELLFRSGAFQTMRRDSNIFFATLVSSALFSLIHYNSLRQLIYSFAIGIVLAVMCTVTKSVLPCLIAHIVNNGWLLAVPDSVAEGAMSLWSGSYALYVFIGSAVLITICICLMAKWEKGRHWKVSVGGRKAPAA